MNAYDLTKFENAVDSIRYWIDRRRGEPSHWFAICGAFGALALGGLILAAAARFGIPGTLAALFAVGAAVGALAGQRAEL